MNFEENLNFFFSPKTATEASPNFYNYSLRGAHNAVFLHICNKCGIYMQSVCNNVYKKLLAKLKWSISESEIDIKCDYFQLNVH